jgi:ADP-ribose pyrophosphatase
MIQRMSDAAPRRVELIEKTTPYKGRFQVDRYKLRHELHDGGMSGAVVREVFERGHAAAVLPYDPVRDEVVLIEQFRPGAYAAGMDPWLIEIVAGIIDPGEDAKAVVRREAIEEARLEIGALEPIAHCLLSPGGCSETVTLFCGRADSSAAGGVHGLDHEHEDIKSTAVPFAEAESALAAGRYRNAITLISLYWLLANRPRLRQAWC